MEHLLGITGLLVAGSITLMLVMRYPAIGTVMLVAFLVRAGAALFSLYVAPLPDSTCDAATFERRAWLWASSGFASVYEQYRGPHSYFISVLIGFLYAATDRSMLMAQSLSVALGTGIVFLAWRLSSELWGERIARKAAWATALFPTLILYASMTRREAYIVFFFLLGLLGVVRWIQSNHYRWVIWALLAFVAATFFHGGMFVAALVLAGLVGWRECCHFLPVLYRGRIRPIALVGMLAVIFCVLFVVPAIPYFKMGAALPDRVHRALQNPGRDTAAFPDWVIPRKPSDYAWALPLQTGYFLFAPFPWDVRTQSHLIGLFDGTLYLVLISLILRKRKSVWHNPGARAVLLILIPLVVTFTIGTTNFGAGIRHRAKFAAVFIVLAAPALPQLVWSQRRPSASTVFQNKTNATPL